MSLVYGLVGLIVVCSLFGCNHHSFQTQYMLEHGVTTSSRQAGKALLVSCIKAHGGSKHWQQLKSWSIEGQEIRRSPLSSYRIKRSYRGLLASSSAVQSGVGLSEEFDLATMKLFFEMPFSFVGSQLTSYAGTAEFRGRSFDLIYTSLPGSGGEVNHFILWVSRLTKLLHLVQYDLEGPMLGRSQGTVILADHRVIRGIVVPFKMRVIGDPKNESFQKGFDVDKVTFDAILTKNNNEEVSF